MEFKNVAMKKNDFQMDIWDWYNLIPQEFDKIDYTLVEKNHYWEYYNEAGLLSKGKKAFFKKHYANSFSKAEKFLMYKKNPLIVDLGGGSGTQLIYLALKGAKIICIDLDSIALRVLVKRIKFYEEKYNCEMDITILEKNTFEVDYSQWGEIDGLYSMFAFNMMQPSNLLLEKIIPNMSIGSKIAIIDGNQSCYLSSILKLKSRVRDVWTPVEFKTFLEKRNFEIEMHNGGVSLPPIIWSMLPFGLANFVDTKLCANWFFPISHEIYATKQF